MTGPTAYHDLSNHASVVAPQPQRQVGQEGISISGVVDHVRSGRRTYEDPQAVAPSDDDIPELLAVDASQGQKTKVSETWMPHQELPPTTIHGMNIQQLLEHWTTSAHLWAPYEEGVGPEPVVSITPGSLQASLHEMPKSFQDDEAMVIGRMYHVIAEATGMPRRPLATSGSSHPVFLNGVLGEPPNIELEMVGLIPNNLEIPFLSGPAVTSVVDASLLALGVFSRGLLEDDSRGSLRRKVEEQYGTPWTHCRLGSACKNQFGVFAIEGLAHAPGLLEPEATVLLSKLEKYAHKDHSIVWLPKHAYVSSDGTDLVEYYVRLGFQKVVMANGLFELLYMGAPSSAEAVLVEHDQIMVGIDLQRVA